VIMIMLITAATTIMAAIWGEDGQKAGLPRLRFDIG